MATVGNDTEHEKQPLQQSETRDEDVDTTTDEQPPNSSHDPNLTGQSLIRHTDSNDADLVSPYQVDPTLVTDSYENPYKETTDNDQTFIRRVPSSDIVPKPFKKFSHVFILSIIAAVGFIFVGFFAVRLARRARVHHSRGLYGLAQRDSLKSVILSYLSLVLSFLLIVTIIVLASAL